MKKSKEDYKTTHPKTRSDWRKWLEKNQATSPGIWIIYYKKESGKRKFSYADAVEEALCFGWIDSTIRPLDNERYMQRFTPRKPKSGWSAINKKRIEKMMEAGLMTKAGHDAIEIAKKNDSWNSLDKFYAQPEELEIPEELAKAFQKNKKAKVNFEKFSVSVKRLFLNWIHTAKRPETKKARIKQTMLMAAANKKPTM